MLCLEVTVVRRGCRHGREIQPKKLGEVFQDYKEYASCVRELDEQEDGCFFRLIVSKLFPPYYVQRCLSRLFIGIGCDVSESNVLTALVKNGGETILPTRKM